MSEICKKIEKSNIKFEITPKLDQFLKIQFPKFLEIDDIEES